MTAKRLIVESAVKAALKEASGLDCISTEAVEWVNDKTALLVGACAEIGRRTPGGRLMAPLIDPDGSNARPTVTIATAAEPRADGRKLPERLDARAKEFANLSPEHQAEIVHRLYVQAPAINQDAIDLLEKLPLEVYMERPIRDRIRAIVDAAKGLEP